MKRKGQSPAPTLDLFLSIASELGVASDRELATLAGVSVETVVNWRTGAVQEVKPQKLAAMKSGLAARIATLRRQAHAVGPDTEGDLCPIEVEEGSGPSDLQREFRERIMYDYLGHRFLYYDPQGALAWEMLIGTGYEQERWLRGVDQCLEAWLDTSKDGRGRLKGVVAQALGLGRGGRPRGLDVVSLGPGEGGKEIRLMHALLDTEQRISQTMPWIATALVDVSIPLLLKAARAARNTVAARQEGERAAVLPICADFEEGPMHFAGRLPTELHAEVEGLRLVLLLGNNFGNLRDEEAFVRQRLWKVVRPGDFVWIEVGLRPERLEDEPLSRLTQPGYEETAADTCRRILLQGPYRRWEAALGRPPSTLDMRVWVREDDDSARVPGSVNFCHDLTIKEEQRACSMLYSRRYDLEGLTGWLEEMGFAVERIVKVEDSRRRPRVAHLALRRS